MSALLDLHWDVFVTPGIPTVTSDLPPGTKQQLWSPIASTLISGKRDAILVDTFLTVEPAGALVVDGVAASGKNLTTIDATHGHGDHCFGASIVLQPGNDDSPTIIEETRQYIRDVDRVAGTTTTARELYDTRLECYPERVNPGGALWLTARGHTVIQEPNAASDHNRRTHMRAMRAEQFSGYEGLKLVDLPKPAVSDGKVLLRMTAAGVTPLEHTILSGQYPGAKAPLILGGEGAGVVEEGGGTDFPVGARVMFTGPYGVSEDGAYSEWLAVRQESLCRIPEGVDDVSAAGLPVAYLTAQMALTLAGFQAGKTVLAPAIGGSVGNAVTQLARALGAKHAISTTTNHAKAEQAKALGFTEVIDTSLEKLGDGVRRITGGDGADIVIDGVGGDVLSEALGALALGGSLTTLGYAAGRQATIDVTHLIWKRASIKSFSLFAQPQAAWADAWNALVSLLQSGAITPIVAKTFSLAEAADALRYLVEGRPFGRVVLTI